MVDLNDDYFALIDDLEDLWQDGDWTPPNPKQKLHVGQKCPQCGNMIVLVTNYKTGHVFAGCSNWPKCDVTGRTA